MKRSSAGSETVQPVSLCMSLERTFKIGRDELLGEAKWNTVSFMLELISPGCKNGVGMERGNKDAECTHESTRKPQDQLCEKSRTFSIHTCGLNDGFLCSLRFDLVEPGQRGNKTASASESTFIGYTRNVKSHKCESGIQGF